MIDSAPSSDPLFELERKIARRADELSQRRGEAGRYPLATWLEAEWEIAHDEFRAIDTPVGSPIRLRRED